MPGRRGRRNRLTLALSDALDTVSVKVGVEERDAGTRAFEIRDCRGRVVRTDSVELTEGLHKVEVPAAGVAVVR